MRAGRRSFVRLPGNCTPTLAEPPPPSDDGAVRSFVVNLGLFSLALLVLAVTPSACARRRQEASPEKTAPILPGSPGCYNKTGAALCPRDPSDPAGLPRSGAVCTVPVCKTCGSDQVPAYRDATGAPHTGWCICVEKSDDSGVRIYSCGPQPWGQQG